MTDFFSSFPTIAHNKNVVQDITVRLDFLARIKDNVSLFEYKVLRDNEKPEDIALQYYGDASLYWIVLFMNDVVDPYNDWLMSDVRLNEYVVRKYGAENVHAIHHHETTASSDLGEGVWVNSDTPFIRSITNYEYESDLNEKKRRIKMLKERYIPQIIAEYKKELRDKK